MLEGDEGEALTLVTEDAVDLVMPLRRGLLQRVSFHWTDRSQTLSVTWPEGAEGTGNAQEPVVAFGEARAAEQPSRTADEGADRLCACYQEVVDERACRNRRERDYTYVDYDSCENRVCTHLFGTPTEECLATHGEDCDALLRCVHGDRSASPACPEGHAVAGGTGHCFALCDDAHPCETGRCEPWQGTGICRP